MKTFICEICGDAYLGEEKPHNCPFCGARGGFIKEGNVAEPIVKVKDELSETSRNNILATIALEMRANATYICMANQAHSYEIMALYKRLAKVELEHAIICSKLLGIKLADMQEEECSHEDAENFLKTVELEDHASELYKKFAAEATEVHIRKFFAALTQAEADHIALINNYLAK